MQLREKFDPDRQFVVNKAFRWAGDQMAPGSVFPKQLPNLRRLRQLYDARFIRMAPAGEIDIAGIEPIKPVMPDFHTLSEYGLRQWLTNTGVEKTAHSLKGLISQAEARWRELNNVTPMNMEPLNEAIAEDNAVMAETVETLKEPTNGVADPDRDRKHRRQRVQKSANDGNPKAPATKQLERKRGSGGNVQRAQRRRNKG